MQLHKSGCQSQVKKRNFFISKLTCPFKILEEKEKLLFWLLKPFSNFGIYQKLFANFVLGITFMLTAQSQTSHCILRCNKVPCIAFMIELIHGDVFILGHNHMEINKCRTKGQPFAPIGDLCFCFVNRFPINIIYSCIHKAMAAHTKRLMDF